MIQYNFGWWGIGFIWKLNGSVFHKAVFWALPSGVISYLMQWYIRHPDFGNGKLGPLTHGDVDGSNKVWSTFTFIVGLLLVFRTQIAHGRFWEGTATLHQIRGSWFNAFSNLVAFCSDDPTKHDKVVSFQHLLVRLMSFLHCASLQRIATIKLSSFEVMDPAGLSEESLLHLKTTKEKPEVILQWIQRLIMQNCDSGVLAVPAPILSRVFQELSNGMIDLNSARRLVEYPFPFPYAQILTAMLLLNWHLTPLMCALTTESASFAFLFSFSIIFACAALNYIAAELEMPFGDDPNDLPIADIHQEFNESLRLLLHPLTQNPPQCNFNVDVKARTTVCKSEIFITDDGTRSDIEAQPPELPRLTNKASNARRHRSSITSFRASTVSKRSSIRSSLRSSHREVPFAARPQEAHEAEPAALPSHARVAKPSESTAQLSNKARDVSGAGHQVESCVQEKESLPWAKDVGHCSTSTQTECLSKHPSGINLEESVMALLYVLQMQVSYLDEDMRSKHETFKNMISSVQSVLPPVSPALSMPGQSPSTTGIVCPCSSTGWPGSSTDPNPTLLGNGLIFRGRKITAVPEDPKPTIPAVTAVMLQAAQIPGDAEADFTAQIAV